MGIDPDLYQIWHSSQAGPKQLNFVGYENAKADRLITRIRERRGCGVLMVPHDLHLVMASTDMVVCLNHHVCCQGLPETVSKHPEYLSLFGPEEARGMAVYTHHHDHRHDDGHDEGHDHEDHDHG